MVDAALTYARAGWATVPLVTGTKRPLVKTGRDHAEAATCDLDRITDWWTRWPDAGIGLVCGVGGFLVIDVDGDEGRETFLAHHGPFPLTTVATSGRQAGGLHLFYRLPVGVTPPRPRELGPGLELKASGSLVVLTPSLHGSGRRYAWDVPPSFMVEGGLPVDPQAPPGWMLEDPRGRREPLLVPVASTALNGAVATRYGARVLREELERLAAARPGTRNNVLFRVAVRLAELAGAGHLDVSEARRRVEQAAEHAYRGEDVREREATIVSAFGRVAAA